VISLIYYIDYIYDMVEISYYYTVWVKSISRFISNLLVERLLFLLYKCR